MEQAAGARASTRPGAAAARRLAPSAARALETLWLWSNEIGDDGSERVRHLGDALTRGAAPALEELYLRGNPASDAAKQALLDARPGLRIFY